MSQLLQMGTDMAVQSEQKSPNPKYNQEQVCLHCGNQFWVARSELKLGRGKYCSIECRAKAKENKQLCICRECGKEFYRVPADVKRGHAKYCSVECARKGHRLKRGRQFKLTDPNLLRRLYCDQNLSCSQIAKQMNVGTMTIWRALKRYKIPINPVPKVYISENTLYKSYWEEGLTLIEIAQKFGISDATVDKLVKRYKMPTRNKQESISHSIRRKRRTYYKGDKSISWKGGRIFNGRYWYIYSPEHPNANIKGYVPEHILVWEKANNKILPDDWCVHHMNGNKQDNELDNLIAMPRAKHDRLIPFLLKEIHKVRKEMKHD